MRFPRLRFTVRRLMFAVAVVAVLLTGGIWLHRALDYRKRAEDHASQEWSCQNTAEYDLASIDGHRKIHEEYARSLRSNHEKGRKVLLNRLEKNKKGKGLEFVQERRDIERQLTSLDTLDKRMEALISMDRYVTEKIAAKERKAGEHFRLLAEWHARLKRKYRRAMWHPWAPVAPDSPPPVWR